MIWKKIFSGMAAVLLAVTVFVLPASAALGIEPDFTVNAEAAYIVNLDTGIVVYEKNSETSMAAASLTKLMTMILLLKNYQDQLDSISVTAPSYIYDLIWEKTTNASTADIRSGETVTLRQLLYAMELPSGNEAAYIVADYMGGGSIDNFVAMMNEEAAAIGCTGTAFADPCGLDLENVTTARDAYLLLKVAMGYDAYAQAAAATTYDMGANDRYTAGTYLLQTTDKMLVKGTDYYRSYTLGGKTGSLENWQNFAGMHSQDGESYISVVLHSPLTDEEGRPALKETGSLMDWAFATFTVQPALDTTSPIIELPIRYSTQTDTVMIYPADDMMTLLPRDGDAALTEQSFDVPDYLTAPIRQGDVVGTVTLSIGGEKLGTVDLIAGSDVDRNQVLYTVTKVGEFFGGSYFKVVGVVTVVVLLLFAFGWIVAFLISLNNTGDSGPKAPRRRK